MFICAAFKSHMEWNKTQHVSAPITTILPISAGILPACTKILQNFRFTPVIPYGCNTSTTTLYPLFYKQSWKYSTDTIFCSFIVLRVLIKELGFAFLGLVYSTAYQLLVGYSIPKFESLDYNHNFLCFQCFIEIFLYHTFLFVYYNYLFENVYMVTSILI